MTETTEPNGPNLTCFSGQAAPPPILMGWSATLELPEGAQEGIWELLGPVLTEPHGPGLQHLAENFGERHGVPAAQLAASMETLASLFRHAAAHDMSAAQFRADLVLLSKGDRPVVGTLVEGFEQAKVWLRDQAYVDTLADQGNVLTGLSWQVGQVQASDRAGQLNRPVVGLTLRYRSGESQERLSLQLTPDGIQQLVAFCERFRSS